MAARVCGAVKQRSLEEQRACWCGGFFCGPGGHKQSKQFRTASGTSAIVSSREEFDERMKQLYMFDNQPRPWRFVDLVDAARARARRGDQA